MPRTTINLPQHEFEQLKQEVERQKRSQNEIVREALRLYLAAQQEKK